MQYRPLRFFWVVEFSGGSAVAQFDPDTGEEVQGHPDWLPSETDENGMIVKDGEKILYRDAYPIPKHFEGKRVVRIGWYPFSREFATKIFGATGKLVIPSDAKPVVVDLKDGEESICYRQNSIRLHMKGGSVEYAETVYVLGVKGKSLMYLDENGTEVT